MCNHAVNKQTIRSEFGFFGFLGFFCFCFFKKKGEAAHLHGFQDLRQSHAKPEERECHSVYCFCHRVLYGSLTSLQNILTWRKPLSQHRPLVPHRVAGQPQNARRPQQFLQKITAQIESDA